jgi:hypothetical protein
MLSSRYRPWHVPIFLAKYAWLRARNRPVLLNFEVTMRCNASCGFCDYWKTPPDAKQREMSDFAEIARRFSPMLITFTGGSQRSGRISRRSLRRSAPRSATPTCR